MTQQSNSSMFRRFGNPLYVTKIEINTTKKETVVKNNSDTCKKSFTY